MSKLDDYAKLVEVKKEFFSSCIRKSDKFALLPTNRGGVIFTYDDKQVATDLSIKQLRDLKDLIDCFLNEVA